MRTQLNVSHVLEGTVAAVGNTIRFSAELVDPQTDTRLFLERYEATTDDIFALQDSIAAQVVSALRVTLLGPMPTLQETDPEAYRIFLQAKHIADQLSQHEAALSMFESVLAIDPDHWPSLLEIAVIYLDWTGLDGLRLRDHRERACRT